MKKVLLGLLVALAACTPAITPTNTPYLDRTLSRASVVQGGIAVMPVLLTQENSGNLNRVFPEVMGRISQQLGAAMQSRFDNTKIVPIETVLSLLGPNEDIIEYAEGFMLTTGTFQKTGLVKSSLVNAIATRAKTRFVILAMLQSIGVNSLGFSTILWDSQDRKQVFVSTDFAEFVKDAPNEDERFYQTANNALAAALTKLSAQLP
jgi:hypothetical protein